MESKPAFVHRDGMLSDAKYVEWLSDVKARFCQSQIKASIRVNTAMLELYWSIGRDLVALRAEERWGAGVVKQFALDMRQAFPETTGFSDSNVKYMKQWYLFYYKKFEKSQQLVGQLSDKKSHQLGDQLQDAKGQQPAGFLEMPEVFGKIPWGQHIFIISKCQSLEEALFYINKVADEGWSRSFLENQIAANLFLSQGAAVTNFERTLPSPQNLLAKEMLKDPYHFDFLSMTAEYDERDQVCHYRAESGKIYS